LVLPEVRKRFEREFELIVYRAAREISCDALYVIKRGVRSAVTRHVPELNHAFHDVSEPHGHRFAAISETLARAARRHLNLPAGRTLRLPRLRKPPVVPHMVAMPTVSGDVRSSYGIPEEAVVFGRHGAVDTFDISFVHDAVREAVVRRPDAWFLFLNTDRFVEHPRVVHLPRVPSREDVQLFVNSCDYMLHANSHGENFGLAVAEFAVAGTPVMTYLGSPGLAHLELLPAGLRLGYRNEVEVLHYLTALPRRREPVLSDVRSRYSAETVMERFNHTFLS